MEKYICVDRQRDSNGNIVKYIFMNLLTNSYHSLEPDAVRNILRQNNGQLVNLKLSKDNRVLLVNDNFQNAVDKTNVRHDSFIKSKVESYVDSTLTKILDFGNKSVSSKGLISFSGLNTDGDVNSFKVYVKASDLGYSDSTLVLRYRKDITELGNKRYKAVIKVGVVGIISSDSKIKISSNKVFTASSFTFTETSGVTSLNIKKEYDSLLNFIADVCKTECSSKRIKLVNIKDKAIRFGIRSTAVMLIAASCISLTACGINVSTYADNSDAVVAETTSRTYDCDYKSLALSTKITTTINGDAVTIKGNIFKLVTDPLKMIDSEGTVLAEATDSYNIISEDDHTIIVNGSVDVIMSGNFDFIGKSYKLYDKDGNHIGNFERSKLTSMGATITDIDGNIIAEYSRAPFMNDYSVTINDNDKMSDESILMIMASFVSDQKYEDSSSSSSKSS